ncbi:MAG: HAD family phosphatase [Chloroflexi bacterium]|nr:HAD family phosphatase [Chloroflexota bacterium]
MIGILWDMDGVIADTGEAHFLAWQILYGERGQSITYDEFAKTFGMSNLPILRAWLGDGVPLETLQVISARKEELFREQAREHTRLLPGVLEWLERGRARGYRQAVASSGPLSNVVALVTALNIPDYFEALVSGAFLPRSKPDPAVFIHAAGAIGVPPHACLVIEDSTAGIQAAQAAGIACLAVMTTHSADKLTGADLIVDSLSELPNDAFERLIAAKRGG